MGLVFIYPALPICLVLYVQKSDFHLISVFCVVIVVKKCIMSSPGSLLFCTVWQQDTFGAYDQTYTLVQPAVQTARWS